MTVTRCLALCTTVAAAGALLHASDRPLSPNPTVPSVRLTTISAKVRSHSNAKPQRAPMAEDDSTVNLPRTGYHSMAIAARLAAMPGAYGMASVE